MVLDNCLLLFLWWDEMLLLFECCFNLVFGIEDGEFWFYYYILGKIIEKLKKFLSIYFEYY